MKEESIKTILDQIAEDKGINTEQDLQPKSIDKKDLGKKIAIICIVLALYAGIMVALFTTRSLIFLILLVAFIFCVKPLLKLLRKIFHVKDKNSDIG